MSAIAISDWLSMSLTLFPSQQTRRIWSSRRIGLLTGIPMQCGLQGSASSSVDAVELRLWTLFAKPVQYMKPNIDCWIYVFGILYFLLWLKTDSELIMPSIHYTKRSSLSLSHERVLVQSQGVASL
ncbi:hypothetical protein BJX61DRAFT_489005, partial [Aspergillus egyptiacus]